MNRLKLIALAALSALLTGCASVPTTSAARDADAKKFQPEPGHANIYINRRNVFVGGAILALTQADDRVVGPLAPGTFQLVHTPPGKHLIMALNQFHEVEQIEITTEKDKNYFFDLSVTMGLLHPGVKIKQIADDEGRKGVLASKRAETFDY